MYGSIFKGVIALGIGTIPEEHVTCRPKYLKYEMKEKIKLAA